MNKSNLIKTILIITMSLVVALFALDANVLAATNTADDFEDLTNTINSTNNAGNNTSNGTNNTANRANTSNTSNSTNNTARNNSTNNTANNAARNNSSVYNNSSLPSTGISDSIPVAVLIVVLGISAVYAYKKMKDYRNI